MRNLLSETHRSAGLLPVAELRRHGAGRRQRASLVNQLTNGNALDLVNQLSYTTLAGGGAYSAYIGAIVDTARILSFAAHRAFPVHSRAGAAHGRQPESAAEHAALVSQSQVCGRGGAATRSVLRGRNRSIRSNAGERQFLRAANRGWCCPLKERRWSLPLRWLTDLYSTLQASETRGAARAQPMDVPVTGGRPGSKAGWSHTATSIPRCRRRTDWRGPRQVGLRRLGRTANTSLFTAQPGKWTLDAADQTALVVGRDDTLHIEGQTSVCVEKVEAQNGGESAPSYSRGSPPDPELLR
jgi:hypothetical protein